MRDPLISASEALSTRGAMLFDARSGQAGRDAYEAGHVRGAQHADLDRQLSASVEDASQGGRHPLPDVQDFCAQLGAWGVTPGDRVLIYDDQGGANAAARLWWMLTALGHERVQVVDGGLAALRRAGAEMTQEVPQPPKAGPYPAAQFAAGQVTLAHVDAARQDPQWLVIDVRTPERFAGDREPIDPVAGHIPGAVNVPLSENLDERGCFKTASELRALYEEILQGRDPSRTIVHCGSGVTACHTLLALRRAALPGAALYVGSWSEWCRTPGAAREPG